MDELGKKLLSVLGVVFGAVLLVFTGTQTYDLLYQVSGNQMTAAIGLVLFEGGLLYWWYVFQRGAEGLFQLAISLLMFAVCLFLVVGATALNLGAAAQDFIGSNTPAKIITIAVLVQLAAKLIYPLVSPDKFTEITEKANDGKIMAKAYKSFATKQDDIAAELADDMAQMWLERSRATTLNNWTTSLNKRLPEQQPAQLAQVNPASAETYHGANGVNPMKRPNDGR